MLYSKFKCSISKRISAHVWLNQAVQAESFFGSFFQFYIFKINFTGVTGTYSRCLNARAFKTFCPLTLYGFKVLITVVRGFSKKEIVG